MCCSSGSSRICTAREAALLFSSGYVANDAARRPWPAEGPPGCIVFSDALNHASMIAGIRHSRAEKHIFRHNDPADLARLFAGARRPAEARVLRVGLFDGWRHRPDRRIVRCRRSFRRDDLSRRGARGRPLRPARRRHRRAPRGHAPPDRDPGARSARPLARSAATLPARRCSLISCAATRRASFSDDVPAPGLGRRRARRDPPSEGEPNRTRSSSGARV